MIVYGLSLGSLGTAIATWRNSLVFHSPDKVISLAIHFLPPFLMTVIRHYLDDEKGNRWRMAAKTVAKGRQGNEWTGMSAVLICMGACAYILLLSCSFIQAYTKAILIHRRYMANSLLSIPSRRPTIENRIRFAGDLIYLVTQ